MSVDGVLTSFVATVMFAVTGPVAVGRKLTVTVTGVAPGASEPVQPGAVIGRSGTLGVRYTVTNTTGKTQDVSYDDGTGRTVTTPAETVVPMIGQLVTVLPPSFTLSKFNILLLTFETGMVIRLGL